MASTDEFHTPNKNQNDESSSSSAAQTPLAALFAQHSRSVCLEATMKRCCAAVNCCAAQTLKPQAAALDYVEYIQHRVSGLYILPDPCDTSLWHGSVSIRVGAYKGACFRFHLRLAAEHPAAGAYPTVQFIDSVFHPLVDAKTGRLQLKDRFPSWEEDSKPADVAIYAKQIFMMRSDAFGTDNPLNTEALNLWKKRPEAFYSQAARCAQRSALGRTPPGSPAGEKSNAAGGVQDTSDAAGVFSSFLKSFSSSVLSSAPDAAEQAGGLPSAEEHLLQFTAPADEVRDVRRFVTSQTRSGAEMLRFLMQGQKTASS